MQLVRSAGFGAASAGRGGVVADVPGDDPQVIDGEASYWLLPTLRVSAVDAATLRPIGQEMPVPEWQSYPNGFLWRYCWW